jgi:hypothetical protein
MSNYQKRIKRQEQERILKESAKAQSTSEKTQQSEVGETPKSKAETAKQKAQETKATVLATTISLKEAIEKPKTEANLSVLRKEVLETLNTETEINLDALKEAILKNTMKEYQIKFPEKDGFSSNYKEKIRIKIGEVLEAIQNQRSDKKIEQALKEIEIALEDHQTLTVLTFKTPKNSKEELRNQIERIKNPVSLEDRQLAANFTSVFNHPSLSLLGGHIDIKGMSVDEILKSVQLKTKSLKEGAGSLFDSAKDNFDFISDVIKEPSILKSLLDSQESLVPGKSWFVKFATLPFEINTYLKTKSAEDKICKYIGEKLYEGKSFSKYQFKCIASLEYYCLDKFAKGEIDEVGIKGSTKKQLEELRLVAKLLVKLYKPTVTKLTQIMLERLKYNREINGEKVSENTAQILIKAILDGRLSAAQLKISQINSAHFEKKIDETTLIYICKNAANYQKLFTIGTYITQRVGAPIPAITHAMRKSIATQGVRAGSKIASQGQSLLSTVKSTSLLNNPKLATETIEESLGRSMEKANAALKTGASALRSEPKRVGELLTQASKLNSELPDILKVLSSNIDEMLKLESEIIKKGLSSKALSKAASTFIQQNGIKSLEELNRVTQTISENYSKLYRNITSHAHDFITKANGLSDDLARYLKSGDIAKQITKEGSSFGAWFKRAGMTFLRWGLAPLAGIYSGYAEGKSVVTSAARGFDAAIDVIPGIGTIKQAIEFANGQKFFSGEKQTQSQLWNNLLISAGFDAATFLTGPFGLIARFAKYVSGAGAKTALKLSTKTTNLTLSALKSGKRYKLPTSSKAMQGLSFVANPLKTIGIGGAAITGLASTSTWLASDMKYTPAKQASDILAYIKQIDKPIEKLEETKRYNLDKYVNRSVGEKAIDQLLDSEVKRYLI